MSARRTSILAAVAAALALALPAAAAPEPYVIDVVLDASGANTYAGQTEIAAFKVFEQWANRSGGVNGRPLHFEIHDDQTQPAVAVQLTNQILAKKPVVMLGSGQVQTCAAIAPLFANGPVDYCLTPGFSPSKDGYVFAASASLDKIVPAQIRFARGRKLTRIGYLTVNSATGQAADASLRYALALPENREMKVVQWESFTPGDVSVNAQAVRLKAADPQVIITPASGAAFGTALHGLNDVGLHVPVLTSAANEQPEQLKGYEAFAPSEMYFNGMLYYAIDTIAPGPLHNAIEDFYAAFRAAGVKPTPDSGQAWDPALIVLSGLRKLGPTATAAGLRDYIRNLHGFAGSSGFYDFRSNDGHGLDDSAVIFVRWDPKRGDFVNASRRGGAPL